jgi:hypothetical protein
MAIEDDDGSAAANADATTTKTIDPAAGAEGTTATETQGADAGKAVATETAKPSLLDAVKASLDKSRSQTATAGKADAGSQAKAETSTQEKKDGEEEDRDPTDDELAAMAPNDRRSTRRALRQRNEARDQLRSVQAEFDAVVPEVEGFRRLVGFVNQNGLSTQEVNTGLGIMAAMKNDPERCLEMLTPYYEQLLTVTGRGSLPPELQKAVDDGEITEQHARRLAAAEATKGIATKRVEHVTTQTAEEREAAARHTHTVSTQNAMNAWETRMLTADPDYNRIRQMFQREVRTRVLEGSFQPKTPQDVAGLLDAALADFKKAAGVLRPAATQTRELTPVRHTNGSGGHTAPKPSSFAEAVKLGVAGTGR